MAAHPELAGFVQDHRLGDYRRLSEPPAGHAETRRALHRLAFFVVAPKRYSGTGKLGLRYTHRGFATPFFGADEQVRVEGDRLVYQQGDAVRSIPITTLEEAAGFLGIQYRDFWFDGFHDPPDPSDPLAELTVDPATTDAIGDWFGFATSVLEELRRTPGAEHVSRVQL